MQIKKHIFPLKLSALFNIFHLNLNNMYESMFWQHTFQTCYSLNTKRWRSHKRPSQLKTKQNLCNTHYLGSYHFAPLNLKNSSLYNVGKTYGLLFFILGMPLVTKFVVFLNIVQTAVDPPPLVLNMCVANFDHIYQFSQTGVELCVNLTFLDALASLRPIMEIKWLSD